MARFSKDTRHNSSSPAEGQLLFPLGLVSPGVRPYLELIRLHKVHPLSTYRYVVCRHFVLACWYFTRVLAIR